MGGSLERFFYNKIGPAAAPQLEGTPTPIRPFGRATRALWADSDILLSWSRVDPITIDDKYVWIVNSKCPWAKSKIMASYH
jgi:hypothetical protein